MEFELTAIILAPPATVYAAWLSSAGHTAMTGSPATASAEPGGTFEAWGGYIRGRNLLLEPDTRIVQAWRTSEFAASDPDSRLTLSFTPVPEGTRLVLEHTDLPAHGAQYKTGWVSHYFEPMQRHFATP